MRLAGEELTTTDVRQAFGVFDGSSLVGELEVRPTRKARLNASEGAVSYEIENSGKREICLVGRSPFGHATIVVAATVCADGIYIE